MPVILRKRLDCHYCGKRLNAARKSNNKINCTNCLADNYLDAQNNIIDVPVDEATQSNARRTQAVEVESASDIFCKTCLTNQSFYRRALADYLPDEDDPRYEELEQAFPDFQKDLELRYPQCCIQCAPKVQAQIQQANYAAKTDHLRRLMHRKHERRTTPALRFRSFLISLAGLGHISGLILQLLWHAVASQARSPDVPLRGITLATCLRTWPVPLACTDYTAAVVPTSLLINLLCIWWNPEWQRRLSGQEGRLRGLASYYTAQVSILALRFALWVGTQDLPSVKPYASAVHAMASVVLPLTAGYAHMKIIKLDNTPLVDWSKVNKPLVDPNQFHPPTQRHVPPTNTPPSSQFSIGSLAGPSQPVYDQWQPPTPPGDDTMDWAPTSQSFNPRPRQPKPRFDQPSPFYGVLPAAPVRGSLDPRRPEQPAQKKALGVPPGFFGLSKSRDQSENAPSTDTSEFSFAPARFFAHEREADTGLENIFDKMFSVRDPLEPAPRQAAPSNNQSPFQTSTERSKVSSHKRMSSAKDRFTLARMVVCCSTIIALVVVTISTCIIDTILPEAQLSASNIMPYTALIPAIHFTDQILLSGDQTRDYLAIPVLQGLLLNATRFLKPLDGTEYVPLWNKFVIASMCLLLVQEVYRFCQLQSTSVNVIPAVQTSRSTKQAEPLPVDTRLTGVPPPLHDPKPQSLGKSTDPLSFHAQTQPLQYNPFMNFATNTSPIRKQASDESISSVSSIQTTSTAPGWKTPRNESRTYDWRDNNDRTPRRQSATIARGLGGLSLDNDFGIGSGTGIAGPRTRSQAQDSRNAFSNNSSYGR